MIDEKRLRKVIQSLREECLMVPNAYHNGMSEALDSVTSVIEEGQNERLNSAGDTSSDKSGVRHIINEVLDEVDAASAKFPKWPTDVMHAVGIVNEEVGELNKALLQEVYEPHKNKPHDVRMEAVQTAAMSLRFLANMEYYDYNESEMHSFGRLK